jgi:hypothetical protein
MRYESPSAATMHAPPVPPPSPTAPAPARRRAVAITWVLVPVLLLAGLATWAAWPVCVALPDEALAQFHPPIAQRDDQVWHVRTFQQREGQWYHCKPRIARAFFF